MILVCGKISKQRSFCSRIYASILNGIKDFIWTLDTVPKIKIFLWKAVSGSLTVIDNLMARGMKVDSRCQVCSLEGESINHVLFTCTLARQYWAISNFSHLISGFSPSSVYSNIFYVLKSRENLSIPSNISRAGPWII